MCRYEQEENSYSIPEDTETLYLIPEFCGLPTMFPVRDEFNGIRFIKHSFEMQIIF